MNSKIAVAMSGGVDSSVAAAMMVKKYGKENVFGVTLKLFCYGEVLVGEKSCCSLEAIKDAKEVCGKLGISHYVLNVEKEFEEKVVKNFISEYLAGRTPNPCVRCNKFIKFDWLLKKVRGMGADYLVTGHYARISYEVKSQKSKVKSDGIYSSSEVEKYQQLKSKKFSTHSVGSNNKTFKLLRGEDEKKDQSYFLYDVTQEQLKHLLFPNGEYKKEEVRKMARDLKLKVFDKIESQEICFILNNDYPKFIKERLKGAEIKKGLIKDIGNNVLGEHNGLPFYTIGQRKGIGAHKKPMYVVGMNIKENTLIIGEEKDLYAEELFVKDIHWISESGPKLPLKCKAKIRYQAEEAECEVRKQEARNRRQEFFKIIFKEPQRAITPGQSVVFYLGNECLGGGVIES